MEPVPLQQTCSTEARSTQAHSTHAPATRVRSAMEEDITPPTSAYSEPLTPPPSDEKKSSNLQRVICCLRKITDGIYPKEHPSHFDLQLAEKEFKELKVYLEKEDVELGLFVNENIRFVMLFILMFDTNRSCARYEYDCDDHVFTIRMSGPLHDYLQHRINFRVTTWLESLISGSGAVARFAKRVVSGSNRKVILNSPCREVCPDGLFKYRGTKWPGVILEISYSEKMKDAQKKAEDYIKRSEGEVRMVIVVKTDYGKKATKEASFTIWRREYIGGKIELLTPSETVSTLYSNKKCRC